MAVKELGLLFQMNKLNIALLVDHARPKLIFHGDQNKFLVSKICAFTRRNCAKINACKLSSPKQQQLR